MTDVTKTSQTAQILRYLRAGEKITALEALQMFGCLRLASRMWDIAKMLKPGERIEKQTVHLPTGKRVTQYSINKA